MFKVTKTTKVKPNSLENLNKSAKKSLKRS